MNDISFSSLTESTDRPQTTAHLTWLMSKLQEHWLQKLERKEKKGSVQNIIGASNKLKPISKGRTTLKRSC